MTFKTQLSTDAVLAFLNTGDFAETISYTPKGGVAKSIPAQVFRQRITPAGEDSGRILVKQFEIMIANDTTNGVTSVNKGGDVVSLPEEVGGTSISWIVDDILAQDEGMWHLLIRK